MGNYRKNLVFTAACIGMCFFGVSMIALGSLRTQLAADLQLTEWESTSLVAFLPLGMLIGSLVFGPIVDKYGHKILLVPSCILVLLGMEGIAFLKSIPLLQLSIACIGFGGGVLNGETNALVADISTEEEKGSRLSFLGMFYGIGALCIPTLLTALEQHFTYQEVLLGIGVIMLAGILYCIPVRFPAPKQAQGFPIKEGLGLLKESTVLLFSIILFFQSGIEMACNNWSTSYFKDAAQMPESDVKLMLSCMVAGLTVARLLLVVLFKKMKPETILPWSLVLTALGFCIILFLPGFAWGAIGMTIIGAGLASTFPVSFGILGNRYASLSGTVFGVALVMALIGQTVMNAVLGVVSKAVGIEFYPYVMIVSLGIMFILFKRSLK